MRLDRAIDAFAGASMAPSRWPAALEDLAQSLGADGATLTRGATTRNDIAVSRSLRDVVDEYFVEAASIDPREPRVNPSIRGGFLGDFDNFTADEIAAEPFYTEFLHPRGLGWHATATLSGGSEPILLNLKRRFSRGAYQRDELMAISRALPHLRASAQFMRIGLDARAEDFLLQENAKGRAAILLDVRGRVLEWNAQMVFGDGLAIRNNRLVADLAEDQGKLDGMIAHALSAEPPSGLPVPQVLAVRGFSGRTCRLVRVSRFQAGEANPVAKARGVVSVTDPSKPLSPQASLLMTMFALTPREVEIAILLGQGLSPAEIAERSQITLPHARQRLKSILQKTETTRQGELIALLSRLR